MGGQWHFKMKITILPKRIDEKFNKRPKRRYNNYIIVYTKKEILNNSIIVLYSYIYIVTRYIFFRTKPSNTLVCFVYTRAFHIMYIQYTYTYS